MKVIEDKYVNKCVRHTKVEVDDKSFRRFHFRRGGRDIETLWLSNDSEFLPEGIEKFLEKEFEKVG